MSSGLSVWPTVGRELAGSIFWKPWSATEEVLTEMRTSVPPIYYLVGTPKGRLTKLEADLLERPWQSVRRGVEVKVLPQENELYLFAQSRFN